MRTSADKGSTIVLVWWPNLMRSQDFLEVVMNLLKILLVISSTEHCAQFELRLYLFGWQDTIKTNHDLADVNFLVLAIRYIFSRACYSAIATPFHQFPRSQTVTSFPALAIRHMFFPRLQHVTCFLTLETRFMLSRPCHWLKTLLQLMTVFLQT